MKGQRALVVGGLGFIGSHLTARLVELGAAVTVLTRARASHEPHATAFVASGVRIVEGDIRDAPATASAVDRQDVIFHVAGRSGAVSSMEDPCADLDVNGRGSLVLLESIRSVNPTSKLVFVGSRLEYGRVGEAPVNEDREADPLCIYAVHKLLVEKYLRVYAGLCGLRYVVARVTNPYGLGQPRGRTAYGVVNRMIQLALEDGTLTIYGDGRQRRDYIYIDDVIAALIHLAESPQSDGRVYNVGTGVGTALIDVAHAIVRLAGSGRVEMVEWPALAEQIETGGFVADISRIGQEIGWRPKVALDDGLQRTISFSRAQVAL